MDFAKLRNFLFLGALLAVTVIMAATFRPFAYPIFWAAVLAALFYPFYEGVYKRLKNENLSATITILVVSLIILLPLAIIASLVVHESARLYGSIADNQGAITETVHNLIKNISANQYFSKLQLNEATITARVAEGSREVITFTLNSIKSFTQNSFTFLAMFVVMLYTLFFFLRDGERLLKKIMFLLPLGNKYEVLLYKKFTATARAALKGTLMVGVIQGGIGGVMFALTGVPGPLILGIIMIGLSIIPGVGSSLLWFPVGIIMLIMGNYIQGGAILLVGFIVISTIDNILRPILVGKDLQMHPLLILFSTLGGIALFGVSGFVIGPIFAALFLSFWEMYEHYYHQELSQD